ncbi:MAG: hypothetical protein IPK19_37305 [Chloroflexi bacterium]|nr:hypothetical protein [Chloroflexota bacterium]
MDDLLRRLFGRTDRPRAAHPLDREASSTGDVSPRPAGEGSASIAPPIMSRVLAIIHNPTARSGKPVQVAFGWNDPDRLAAQYLKDVREASYGIVNYEIVDRIEVTDPVRGFPLKRDGFRYSPESFDRAWTTRKFHEPDAVDYLALVREFRMIERVNAGEIDEVWLLGFPYCGYYESIMAGPGAFWCNAPPLQGTEHARRRFVIMGFNYERGVGEMLEDLGHRAESILSKVYERTPERDNLWKRFIRYDRTHPGQAECGNVHFAPNSERDYDWGNRKPVLTRADSWLEFPNLDGAPRMADCADWGGGDIRQHHLWWLRRFPHHQGESGGISWNWWEYVIDPNRVA